MSATFDPTLPTALDRMRLLLGDTEVATAETVLLPDETYLATITQFGETPATIYLAESLATRFAQAPDSVSASGKTVTWKDRVKTWLELANRLRGNLGDTADAASSLMHVVRPRRADEEALAEYVRPEGWYPGW